VAVAAGLGAAVTANCRLRLSAGFTGVLRDADVGGFGESVVLCDAIIYPAKMVPEAWRFWIFWLNPMTAIVEVYRDLVLVGRKALGNGEFSCCLYWCL